MNSLPSLKKQTPVLCASWQCLYWSVLNLISSNLCLISLKTRRCISNGVWMRQVDFELVPHHIHIYIFSIIIYDMIRKTEHLWFDKKSRATWDISLTRWWLNFCQECKDRLGFNLAAMEYLKVRVFVLSLAYWIQNDAWLKI